MKKIVSILLAALMCVGTLPALAAEDPILNNDFESGESGFSARGTASAAISKDTAYSGEASMLVSGRGSNAWEGVGTSIVNDVKLDETYYGQMYVKAANEGESFTVKLTLEKEDENGTDYPQVGSATVNSASWTLVEGVWTADYQGNLKKLNLNIETEDNGAGKSFYVDNIFFANESVPKPSSVVVQAEDTKKSISYSGNTIPEDIADSEYLDYVDMLMSLGVVNGYPDGTFKPDNQVTRAEFLTMLLRLLKLDIPASGISEYTDVPADHFAAGAISWATSMGVCNGYGDGLFGPEDHVTYVQAVKMLISVMGYGTIAELSGGYPNGYMSAASGADIEIQSAPPIDTELTRAMSAELICSALDADLYMRSGNGNVTQQSGKTILSEYYDGGKRRGYIQSSGDATTTGVYADLGTVNIGGENYMCGATRADELVGYYADYIYSDVNHLLTLLYIEPRASKTEEMELSSRNIQKYSDYAYEYETEDGRTKTARLDKDFTLIYNGQTVDNGFNDDMMMPELGTVRLVGTGGGYYNLVYVTSYDTFIVSSVNKTTGDVYDIDNKKFNIDEDDSNVSIIGPDGAAGSLADIRKDDILHIAVSADRTKTVVRVMRSVISGVVTGINSEEITIDGTVYKLSEAYLNRNYRNPSVSSEVTAYLDLNGDVVYMDEGGNTSMEIGFFINAAISENGKDILIRYMTSGGEIRVDKSASTMTIDGVNYKNDINAELAAMRGTDGETSARRIFRYTVDSDKNIRRVDFARGQKALVTDADKREGENTLYAVNSAYIANDGKASSEPDASSIRYQYKYNARTFLDESGTYSSLALTPTTTLFLVPDKVNDYEEYEIARVSDLGYNEQYKVFAYKANTDGITVDYAVLFKSGTGTSYLRSQEGFVVTDVIEMMNRNDESVPGLVIYQNGSEKTYAIKSDDVYASAVSSNDNKDIQPGDVVRFDVDTSGEISNIAVDRGSGSYGDYFYSAQGYIYLKEDGYAYFTSKRPDDSSNTDDMTLIPIDSFSITVYNKHTKQAYAGGSDEIIDYMTDHENYSSVYITMNYENAKTLICVVDY